MIIFFDLAFVMIFAIILGAGITMTLADWILNHLILLGIILAAKSLLMLGQGLLQHKKGAGYYTSIISVIIVDIIRSLIFLFLVAKMLGTLFTAGVLDTIFNLLGLIIAIPLSLCAAEWPVCYIYDEEIEGKDCFMALGLEAVSIIELFLIRLFLF